ncbi:hypothetical protein [Spartinivicinus poritis]|uniref:Uncharacterized protein n=1 Tax=Spartinivicinus poritis TaxID=2994640 RepID=A0ABT5U853_9GAMM|nr:hypothetical protein [Spartinivicinus sp. A2-2]MDE1462545.1 hypothetical protein [Spartinivicinus sp. A2-2]
MPAIFSVSQIANLHTYQETPKTFSDTFSGVLSNGNRAKLLQADSKSRERFYQHTKPYSTPLNNNLNKLARLKIIRILSQGEQNATNQQASTTSIPLVAANLTTFAKDIFCNVQGDVSYLDVVVAKQSQGLVDLLKFYYFYAKEELLEVIKLSELTEQFEIRELDTIIDKLKTQAIRNQNKKQIIADDEYQQLMKYIPEVFINILLINLTYLRQTKPTPI